jgi:nucleotide-binding universal stress UspA family protein
MVAFERLLVPVDFSRCSRRALSVAACFSQLFDSTIDVLHVFEGTTGDSSMKDWPEHLLPSMPSDVAARTRFRLTEGQPAPRICAAAGALESNLIVAGLYGPFGGLGGGTGRVARHLMRFAPCVVIAVDDGDPLAAFDLMNLAVIHASNARIGAHLPRLLQSRTSTLRSSSGATGFTR